MKVLGLQYVSFGTIPTRTWKDTSVLTLRCPQLVSIDTGERGVSLQLGKGGNVGSLFVLASMSKVKVTSVCVRVYVYNI